jgi:hypothetical protein
MNVPLKNVVAGGLLSAAMVVGLVVTYNLKKITAGALVSGAVAMAGLGLAAGTASASPFHWCPGDPPITGVAPDSSGAMKPVPIYPAWDISVCHDYGTTGNHVKEGKACVLPQFQWFQCPPGTIPWPEMPVIPNNGE